MAAVTAHVHECPQLAVARACNYNRNLSGAGGEVRTVFGDLSRMAGVLPRAREDALAFVPQDVGVRVPGPGQRRFHGCEL
jgi:hypothetical protein